MHDAAREVLTEVANELERCADAVRGVCDANDTADKRRGRIEKQLSKLRDLIRATSEWRDNGGGFAAALMLSGLESQEQQLTDEYEKTYVDDSAAGRRADTLEGDRMAADANPALTVEDRLRAAISDAQARGMPVRIERFIRRQTMENGDAASCTD